MASSASKKLLKELPSPLEMVVTLGGLKSISDQAAALMGASYLERALELALKSLFIPLGKKDDQRLFDGAANGVLGTFSAKIRLSYALKILGPITYADLLLINDIRNVFAHSLHKVDFSNDLVAKDCSELQSIKNFLALFSNNPDAIRIADMSGNSAKDAYLRTVMVIYFCLTNEL